MTDPREKVVDELVRIAKDWLLAGCGDHGGARAMEREMRNAAALSAHDAAQAKAGGVPVAWMVVDGCGDSWDAYRYRSGAEACAAECNKYEASGKGRPGPFNVIPLYATPPRAAYEAVAREAAEAMRQACIDSSEPSGYYECPADRTLARDDQMRLIRADEIIARAVAKVLPKSGDEVGS